MKALTEVQETTVLQAFWLCCGFVIVIKKKILKILLEDKIFRSAPTLHTSLLTKQLQILPLLFLDVK